ncbi:MAG: hypothetical protein QOH47_192 [Sphingomonadales bacterium]|jgi:TonB family protein|nr:hypothetical protein [Sphingomonadales bacterium]
MLALLLAMAFQPAPPPAAVPAVRAEPVNPLYAYVTREDYPAAALRGEEQGRTGYRLEIGADGFVRGCTITGSSGSAALDATTCRILRSRVRFVPARDRRGRFVPDSYESGIRWSLPDDEDEAVTGLPTPQPPAFGRAPPAPAPSVLHPPSRAVPIHTYSRYFRRADYPAAARRDREEGQVYFLLTIGANGRVANCEVTATSGSPALDGTTCRILRSRARYAPARDAAGVPVTDTDRGTFVWRLPG